MYINLDGKIMQEHDASISINNRSFRYGDGCFETMKLQNAILQLPQLHFERLFESLSVLCFSKLQSFTPEKLHQQIIKLAEKNKHQDLARIRLTIFRGDGGLYDPENHQPHYLIQTWPLSSSYLEFNQNGLDLGEYTDFKKSADRFSNIKSNNFLGYAMAAIWAKQQKLNDAILLNTEGNVIETTIANIFIYQDGKLKTPALSEGPVAGVMRRFLIQFCKQNHIPIEEGVVKPEEVYAAQEVFLTNSISGIKWVKQIGNQFYKNKISNHLYHTAIKSLIQPSTNF